MKKVSLNLLVFKIIFFLASSSWAVSFCGDFLSSRQENIDIFNLFTERLEIRRVTIESEVDEFVKIVGSHLNNSRENDLLNEAKIRSNMEASQQNLTAARLAFESKNKTLFIQNLGVFFNGKLIGALSFTELNADIMNELASLTDVVRSQEKWLIYGLILSPKYQGQGFGSEITKRRISFAFDSLGAKGIIVDIDDSNYTSIWMSTQKFGFRAMGSAAWWDNGPSLYYLKRNY